MEMQEISLLVTQLSSFHAEVRRVSDAIAETKIDALSKIHQLSLDFRTGLADLERTLSKDIRACESQLTNLIHLEAAVTDLQQASKVMQARQDNVYELLAEHNTTVTVNNNNKADGGGLNVGQIDRVDGDIVQGDKS